MPVGKFPVVGDVCPCHKTQKETYKRVIFTVDRHTRRVGCVPASLEDQVTGCRSFHWFDEVRWAHLAKNLGALEENEWGEVSP